MSIRVRGLCGSQLPKDDDWMFANLRLYHGATLGIRDAEWFASVVLNAHRDICDLHGHPNAPRVVINNNDSVEWLTVVSAKQIRQKSLNSVRKAARQARAGDRLVIYIVGHGERENRRRGFVRVGENPHFGGPSLLQPKDILAEASNSRGDTTAIVDACYSGSWATHLVPRADRGSVLLITGSKDRSEETFSFPRSNSRRFRGGQFGNFLVEGLYKEYGICFPRPQIVQHRG